MEAARCDGDVSIRVRRTVFQIEVEEELSTRQDRMIQAESISKSLSSLINTMRAFGLYFTRESHVTVEMTSQPIYRSIKGCSNCSVGRIYATAMLILMWFNALRVCIVFSDKETLGAALFGKITFIPGALLIAVLHTAYYIASHTGSLDRVFCQADLSTTELSLKYSCRTKVVVVVSWILIIPNIISEAYFLFAYETPLPFLLRLIKNLSMPKICFDIIKLVYLVLNLMAMVSWAFPQALKYIFVL